MIGVVRKCDDHAQQCHGHADYTIYSLISVITMIMLDTSNSPHQLSPDVGQLETDQFNGVSIVMGVHPIVYQGKSIYINGWFFGVPPFMEKLNILTTKSDTTFWALIISSTCWYYCRAGPWLMEPDSLDFFPYHSHKKPWQNHGSLQKLP